MKDIIRLIESSRFDLSNEKRVQAGIESVLSSAGFVFTREKQLSAQDIPDFFIEDGTVIECKLRPAQKMKVFKQLARYAGYDNVTSIILASNVSMTLPVLICEKPAFMASISRGWM